MDDVGVSGVPDTRLDGGTYQDNIVSPYDTNIPGLDMITLNHIKSLRNKVQPMLGYLVGSSFYKDFYHTKQKNHENRYAAPEEREWYKKPGRLAPQVLATTSKGGDNYCQYWDGTFPGTTVTVSYTHLRAHET